TALDEAGQAALQVPPGLTRDLRIMSVVTNYLGLAEAQSSAGRPRNALLGQEELLSSESLEDPLQALKQARTSLQKTLDAQARALKQAEAFLEGQAQALKEARTALDEQIQTLREAQTAW